MPERDGLQNPGAIQRLLEEAAQSVKVKREGDLIHYALKWDNGLGRGKTGSEWNGIKLEVTPPLPIGY